MASDSANQKELLSRAWMGGTVDAARPGSPDDGTPVELMNAHYSRTMFDSLTSEYYAGSDFYNFGYWDEGTTSPKEASEALMEKLLALIPKKSGTILDVACGLGATTRHLLRYYRPVDVTGINISEDQLKRCASNAPGCAFRLMDATRLEFADNSFDNIICVEAAFHFRMRVWFLREAYRVLKPGGRLVMADILMTQLGDAVAFKNPPGNYIEGPAQYKAILARAGFATNDVIDITQHASDGHTRHSLTFMMDKYAEKGMEKKALVTMLRSLLWFMAELRYYVLVSAQKPAGTGATTTAENQPNALGDHQRGNGTPGRR